MDQKRVGYAIIGIGILFIVVLVLFRMETDHLTESLMSLSGGSCFLDDGTCVHEKNYTPLIAGVVVVLITLSLGVYLIFFARREGFFEKMHKNIVKGLSQATKKERLEILLSGLDEDEKRIILAVKDQDGISQTTLKFRTDLSKTKLSVILDQLSRKGLITKVKKGKINTVFLKKGI